jgi:hypothetical protein
VARATPIQGSPSGVPGRWPIQTCTRDAGRSRGRAGKVRSRWSRRIAARRQSGAASSPAISTWPAQRSPLAIGVMAMRPSEGISGNRGTASGALITAW